ncbi:efflux RND transporter permease subunit [uncultured Paenalcaligenes sp.]|uniref:efflux RND transporter permease subunit n=1 Tax=uncultured Paenalcaligenes sp. TaxID=1588925 RepID=UPI002634DB34|nr:efflux RND transporter permease subunit [uncultured Paenalcaligenes sp.]
MRRWLTAFIMRPVATTLLCVAMVCTGLLALWQLPVAPLPQMDFPMISVSASLPGASPETMASSVATPLEQSLGAISGLSEMTSRSSEGSTRITLLFELERDINEAARDVQAAINQARPMLPSGMRGVPSYHKVNPSSSPIMVLAMTSPIASQGQLFDLATTIVAQKLAQVKGVGEVSVGGGSLPAVRISLNPEALAVSGLALDTVRNAISTENQLRPTGYVENADEQWWLSSGKQMNQAEQLSSLIIGWDNDSPIRLRDVALVEDSVEDLNNMGYINDEPGVLIIVRRQADANIIETVESIRERIPLFEAMMPADVRLQVAQDRTPSIRASMEEAQKTLFIAVILVVLVVLVFLRDWRAALIPAVAVPASLISTFALMHLFGFTLNTISLMALIVATGFVVDDAIVVLESIMRYIERGYSPLRAAARGVRDVGFTVTAMSLSLVAVFIPMWLVGGLVGGLFKEFAVTLSVAVMISWLISLILTPMMASKLLRVRHQPRLVDQAVGRVAQGFQRLGQGVMTGYSATLRFALRYKFLTLLSLVATIVLNGYLYTVVPKGLFPQQDTGQLMGFFRADRGMSFEAVKPKLDHFRQILLADPAVRSVAVFAGGRGGSNSSMILVELLPMDERDVSAFDVVSRLRNKLQSEPGARMFLTPQQDIFVGGGLGRSGSYSYSLLASDLALLKEWQPKVQRAMAALPELTDVDTDADDKGSRIELRIDREKATSLGIDMALVASTLNNAFSQRQVSVVYGRLNQYYIVMGVAPQFAQDIDSLRRLEVVTRDGRRVPLAAFTYFEHGNAPLSVSHQGLFIAESVSFGLADGVSLDQAVAAIDAAMAQISLPTHQIQAGYEGSARMMQNALAQQPWLILAALAVMYIVLGMLYESYMHPLTILSTLPSAGIGALLALLLVDQEFSVIALIGVFLLIGIVKKNAIMMVDYALDAQRNHGLSTADAVFEACMIRFRPIMMTTVSAILGAVPLIIATGPGVEMRQPLGLTIVGGLILSQILTLYTTPVVYIYLEKIAQKLRSVKAA